MLKISQLLLDFMMIMEKKPHIIYVSISISISFILLYIAVEIVSNDSPSVDTPISSTSCITAHYPYLLSITKADHFSEPNGETIIYSYTTNQTDDSWLTMTENGSILKFTGTPINSQAGNYTVTLMLDDGNVEVANTTTTFEICVKENSSPALSGTVTDLSQGQVGFEWTYEFDKLWVTEHENEALSFTCSWTPSDPWLSCTENSTHILFQGTPKDNTYTKSYNITVVSADIHTDVADHTFTCNFTVLANDPPTLGTMATQELTPPDSL